MTRVFTLRIPPDLLCRAEARAARLGIDRAKYVRSLIEEDLAKIESGQKHRFASEDLIGCYTAPAAGLSATNVRVREAMRGRQIASREKNR